MHSLTSLRNWVVELYYCKEIFWTWLVVDWSLLHLSLNRYWANSIKLNINYANNCWLISLNLLFLIDVVKYSRTTFSYSDFRLNTPGWTVELFTISLTFSSCPSRCLICWTSYYNRAEAIARVSTFLRNQLMTWLCCNIHGSYNLLFKGFSF